MNAAADLSELVSRRAVQKLNDAAAAVAEMRSADSPVPYRRAFERCVGAIQSSWYRLERDSKAASRSRQSRAVRDECIAWCKTIVNFVEDDDLLRWARDSRHDSTHVGADPIRSEFHAAGLNTADYGAAPEGARLFLSDEGPQWVYNEGTGREFREPAVPLFGTETHAVANRFDIQASRPPRRHRGVELPTRDPAKLCALAIDYWRGVVDEAIGLWGKPREAQ